MIKMIQQSHNKLRPPCDYIAGRALADYLLADLKQKNEEVRFLPSGDRLKPIELVKIQPSARNSFGYEFTPFVSKVK